MFILNVRNSFPLAIVALLSACASAPADREPATTEQRFHFISDTVYRRMLEAASSDKPTGQKLKDVQNVFCNGSNARFSIKHTVDYVPVKTSGMFLDDATTYQKDFLDGLRSYLKRELFFESAGGDYYGGFFDPKEKELHDQYHALYSKQSEEFDFFINTSTFMLPKETIARLKGVKNYNPETFDRASGLHYFGYDDNGFSAKLAIEHRDMLWKLVLASQTELQEVAQSNGAIKFTIIFDLGVFCRHGIPVTSLLAE